MVVTEYRRCFPDVPGHYWIKLVKIADGSWMISAIENIHGDLVQLQNLDTHPSEEGALLAAESLLTSRLSQIDKASPEPPKPFHS